MIYNGTVNHYEIVYGSYTIYIILFAVAFLIILGISSAFIYFYCYLKKIILKQQLFKHINEKYQKIIMENRSYYFFSDTINIKNFDPNLLSIDKISFKSIDAVTYHIKYITYYNEKYWPCKY